AQNLIRYSTNHAASSWKSPIVADIGKADPANIKTLTKGHSGRFSLFALSLLINENSTALPGLLTYAFQSPQLNLRTIVSRRSAASTV
ncbi:MAG: hypothetical protein ABSH48_15855, partial [Verrucomicrobiota bacterium]